MANCMELSKKHNEFIATAGLTVAGFDSLLFYFKKSESGCESAIEGKERKRKHAIYKNSPLNCPEDRLLSVLIYTKQYMTQTALGVLFEISRPKANMMLRYLAPILSLALRGSGSSPCRNMEEIDESQSSTYIHDGTERHINRPRDKKRQKDHYSGKKRLPQQKIVQLQMKNAEQFFSRLRFAEKTMTKRYRMKLDSLCQKEASCCKMQDFKVFL